MREEMVLKTGWKFSDGIVEGGELCSCMEDKMEDVVIPHDWAVGRHYRPDMKYGGEQGFLDRAGIGWYRKHLVLYEMREGYHYDLVFDGVYENATVWMNEKLAGFHRYGYSGFRLDVTSLVKEGDNLLAVKVDNSDSHPDRWYSGAGIYRRVRLEAIPCCHMDPDEIHLKTEVKDHTGTVTARITIIEGNTSEEQLRMPVHVSMEIFSQGISEGKTEIGPVKEQEAELSLVLPSVRRWDAENPCLYEVVLTLRQGAETDEIRRKIGFRTIEWNVHQGMSVNGSPVKLKGVCLHHDAGSLGAAATSKTWHRRLELLKNMGCNAIRTSHNIPDELLMELCDEMGFYVLEEFTDKWRDGSYGRFFDEDWKTDLGYMIKRDRHRPSVALWSVGNEVDCQGSGSMLDILHMLVCEVKHLDGERAVTCALSPHYADDSKQEWMAVPERLDAIERIAKEVDVLALNYQEQWYELIHERLPETVILGSEIYMFFRGHEELCMNYSTDNPWMEVERSSYVAGGFVWAGIDYLGESMGYPSKGWGGSLIKSNLVKKPVAYLWESYWSDQPMVYFCVQDYTLMDDLSREHWSCPRLAPHWNFEQYGRTVIPYMIFSNCEEVRVYINDIRYYVKRPSQCESRIVSGFLPYVPGCVKVVGVNDEKEVCSYELQTAGPAVRLKLEPDERIIPAASDEIVSVLVSAVDRNGTVCFKDRSLLHIKVDGAASLAGVDNGDLMDPYPFQEARVPLHWGKAVLALRPSLEPGAVRILVWADGLMAAEETLEVR